MKEEILLTVFVVTFNRSSYLKHCIESILMQTYRNFQLVILDNASTDNTNEVVKSFNDDRIHYIRHDKNIGGLNNINYAMNICKTKYFVIFHDDDVMNKDLLEKELYELENNDNYAMVSSLCTYIDGEGNEINLHERKQKNKKCLYRGNEYLVNFLSNRPSIVCPSVMYRSSFFKEKKLFFRSDVGPAADQYLWFEVEQNGGIICQINESMMKYRIHEGQDTQANTVVMVVDLLTTVNKNMTSVNKDSWLHFLLEMYSIKLSLAISRKYIDKRMTKSLYCEKMNKLMSEVIKTRALIIMLKCIKMISMKTPFLLSGSYNILKLFRELRGKTSHVRS